MDAKLLLIENDIALSAILKISLAENNFQVEVARDGTSGLQKATTLNPDLVIMDVVLPDTDGWQVLRRLRDMTEMPIIILTTLSSDRGLVRALDLGADAYLVKPVDNKELVALIRALLWEEDLSQTNLICSKRGIGYVVG